ncbi:MAG: mechanosensitive ion channel family protein [Chromatiales bacterium]|nr:mechanosensitive ion channel family protein [Chromatiales bacterium]
MEGVIDIITNLFTGEHMLSMLRALILLLIGLFAARLISRLPQRLLSKHLTAHHSMLARRFIYYPVLGLFIASAMHELGFSLSVLLGAAGVLSVALGFASQTSASNLISGLFLIGERPFRVGDTITVEATTGEVLSIDLLSVKLRTPDNLYVRLPNELLIKSRVINESRFPIRRFDITLSIAYKEDISRIRDLLLALAEHNPLCLNEPPPIFSFTGFGDSSMNVVFSAWARRENIVPLRNSLQEAIKRAMDAEHISLSTSELMLHIADKNDPLGIRVINSAGKTDAS